MDTIESLGMDLDLLQIAKVVECHADGIKNHIFHNKKTFNIITQNIRSVNCNLPGFTTLLQESDTPWDVIVLSECWLPSNKHIPDLDNYYHAATTHNYTQNEGVVIYFNKSLNVTVEEPQIADANCLILKLNNSTCVVGIYRPPAQHDLTNFINSLDQTLASLKSYPNIFLCGDINIDLIPSNPSKRQHEYLDMLASHGMLACHTLPTHGRTCYDHLIAKTKLNTTCIVVDSTITDHYTVAASVNMKLDHSSDNKKTHTIDYPALDFTIQQLDFTPVLRCPDPNTATNLLIDTITSAINKCTKPHKTPKRKAILKPWITKGLLRCIKNRDNLYRKHKKNPDNEILALTYKRYRNYCTQILKKVKINYEKTQIEGAKNNHKRLWQVIKDINGLKKPRDHSQTLLDINCPNQHINEINTYFSNIGKNLTEKIKTARPVNETPHYKNRTSHSPSPLHSLLMGPVLESDVLLIISGLKEKSAVGLDHIPSKLVKRYALTLASPIAYICNLSIEQGTFPSAFKKALIIPIYKSGDKARADNYRPISILPTLSKILERLMNNYLIKFLETNKLLSNNQYGFRHGRSTGDAVQDLVEAIIFSLDNKKKCLAIFLDLKKAFDTVSIQQLLDKMERVGIRGIALALFRDFLSHRTQRTKIGNWTSDETAVTCGLPQGSCISPTLFLIYIDSLCRLQLDGGKVLTFADDTVLFFTSDSWDEVYKLAQNGMAQTSGWLRNNLLTLNTSKTKYMTFALKSNHLPPPTLSITVQECSESPQNCSCPHLERVNNLKYLGVLIDHNMSFKPHLESLANRLRKLIYIFKTMRHIADKRVITMVYNALCQSLINYCITSWGGATKTHLLEVERAQRAILKVAAGLPFRHPTSELYKYWDLLTVRQSFILLTTLKQHSQLHYDPDKIKDKRRKWTVCHIPSLSTATATSFFPYLGPLLYNRLNKQLNIYPLHKYSFKTTVKTYLKSLDYTSTENLLATIT